mgnify:CR=1 FL=1
MTIGTALIGIGMLVLAGIVVAQPLRYKAALPEGSGSSRGSDYDAALLALRDLEFDHQLDVVSDEDYARTKGQLMTQAAQALEQQVEARSQLDDLIETAIRAKRGSINQPVTCQHCHEQLAPDDNFCPQCGRMARVNCPVCQQAGTPGDNFCTGCGTSLKDVLHVAGR